jgi:hypothetical protein
MRACQREGLLRIERDRQGGMRIFPGNITQAVPQPVEPSYEEPSEPQTESIAAGDAVEDVWVPTAVDPAPDAESEVVDGNVLQEREIPSIVDAEEAPAPGKPARRKRASGGNRRAPGDSRARKAADGSTAAPARQRKMSPKPRAGRGRNRTDSAAE